MATTKKAVKTEGGDYGTRELGKKFTIVPKLKQSGGYHAKILDESEIDRLLLKDLISAHEHSLLEAMLERLHRAEFVGIKSPNLASAVFSDPALVGDRKARSIRAAVRMMTGMDKDPAIGRARRAALVNLVLLDLVWPYTNAELRAACMALQHVF